MMNKERITECLVALDNADTSSKALLTEAIATIKTGNSVKSMVTALNNQIQEVAEELHSPKSFVNRAKRMVALAGVIVDTNLFVIPDRLKLYNIEKAVNLMKHLQDKNETTKIKTVKNKLNKVKFKDDGSMFPKAKIKVYNDDYEMVLKELYKEFKLAQTDEGAIIELKASQVISNLSKFSQEELKAIIEASQALLSPTTDEE